MENQPVTLEDLDSTVDQITAAVDELTYLSYKANRQRSPHISPQEWASIYQNGEAMEARFQREIHHD